ncbi:MAG: response regulator [Lachnospiraceae bacterium]|nr:response regulator [Lachnospiraceae bacterium]
MKKQTKLINKIILVTSISVIITILVASTLTYYTQVDQYRKMCMENIKNVGNYLCELILEDSKDFRAYKEYYESHYAEIRIPRDFDSYAGAMDEFFTAFRSEYPDKTFMVDIMPDEMTKDLVRLYYTYRHEYWLLTFEKSREAFNLPYTYFLLPYENTHDTIYMIDGERTEDPEHPGYLFMGDTFHEDPQEHKLLWKVWTTGERVDEVYEWNNEYGNTYCYYTPLVIDGERIGLIATEYRVGDIKDMILSGTIKLAIRLALVLSLVTLLLLLYVNRSYVSRLRHLTDQINEFSSKRAYDTVEAIRNYPYGNDEIFTLADNTADMIRELQIHEGKVRQAAQYKSDFLANMSHEIRTPMNAVVGLSEMLSREDISGKAKEYSDHIHSAAQDLLVIINDILDFSRLESGIVDIIPENYDLRQLMNDTVMSTKMGLRDKPVIMNLNIAEDIPQILYGDTARIRQILNNVISNAVKFTKEGEINIDVSQARVDDKQLKLLISVSDTGIGIEKENLEKIFDSFAQVDTTRSRAVEGTGLGLAITQRLINLMSGTIDVESTYGEGSTFKISIPQGIGSKEEAEAALASEKTIGFHAPDAEVLVVDDNSVNLYIAKSLLGLYDIKPLCVKSGKDAIKAASEKVFDLVLMDYMMPEMDGIEAAKVIRDDNPEYKDVPIIAFTANAVEEAREVLLSSGMDDFIAKPFKESELQKILKKWLPKDKIV